MNDYRGETYYNTDQEQGDLDPEFKRYLTDLRLVAGTGEGQRVLIHILGALGTFDAAWHPKNANMARNVVLKDFGQEILDDLAVASDVAHDNIQRAMRIAGKAALTNQIFQTKTEEM